MYNVLLRNIKTGELSWWDNCYFAGKLKKNKMIIWKSPNDKERVNYKIVAWKWTGVDKQVLKNPRLEIVKTFVDDLLMSFKPRQNDYWQEILKQANNKSEKVYECKEN